MAETSGAESLTTAKATRPLIRSMDGPMDAQRMQFRGNLQQTTTKSNILDAGAIPEGLVYHGSDLYESPIRYHSNRYASELNKNQAMASKPSQKTVDSEGQWEDVDEDEEEDDDDDAWEDIRPPDSTRRGAWDTDGNGSNGSFPVYI